jgi:hypothetical protein
MKGLSELIKSLTTTNSIAIVGIAVGASVAIVLWSATQYLTARREKLKRIELAPVVKATINRGNREGWRSVQLHLSAPAQDDRPFNHENWHIERAILLGPNTAILARAENDDYATKVFYPETPVRVLQGKATGKPQRFALEFYIKFKGNDRGQKAIFNVAFADTTNRRRYSTKVWATVPVDAE